MQYFTPQTASGGSAVVTHKPLPSQKYSREPRGNTPVKILQPNDEPSSIESKQPQATNAHRQSIPRQSHVPGTSQGWEPPDQSTHNWNHSQQTPSHNDHNHPIPGGSTRLQQAHSLNLEPRSVTARKQLRGSTFGEVAGQQIQQKLRVFSTEKGSGDRENCGVMRKLRDWQKGGCSQRLPT